MFSFASVDVVDGSVGLTADEDPERRAIFVTRSHGQSDQMSVYHRMHQLTNVLRYEICHVSAGFVTGGWKVNNLKLIGPAIQPRGTLVRILPPESWARADRRFQPFRGLCPNHEHL
jgi:hypothetical protein